MQLHVTDFHRIMFGEDIMTSADFKAMFPDAHKIEQYALQKSAKIKKKFSFSQIFKQRMSGFKIKCQKWRYPYQVA